MAINFRKSWGGLALLAASVASGVPARAQATAPAADARAQAERARLKAHQQWFLRGRIVPGHTAAELRQRAYDQKLSLRKARQAAVAPTFSITPSSAAVASSAASATGWTSLGPAPLCSDASAPGQQNCMGGYNWVSGRATAVAIDPADTSGNTIYVGGAQGGLWKSTNARCSDPSTVRWNTGGPVDCSGSSQTSLQSLIDDQKSLAVGAIAVQPGNSPGNAVVLVGTGETNSSTDSYYGLGILRSADDGNHWTLIGHDSANTVHSFSGIGFSQIAFSTNPPSLVVAATAGASLGLVENRENAAQTNLGLYNSTDSGLTWNYGLIADGTSIVSPASVTAVVYNAASNAGAGAFFAAVRFHGFYLSTDGQNWTRLANQPGDSASTSVLAQTACPAITLTTCPIYRGALAVVPGRNEMYAWFVDANNADEGIWKTVDGGSNWLRINETGIANCGDLRGCGTENGSYNLTLAAVPNTAAGADLYAGAVNLYKCTITLLYPDCSPNLIPAPPPSATFQNLTHVYGCAPVLGSIARVHPSQHAMDFLTVGSGSGLEVAMYFANDGGIYRTLDGYSGLNSGDCATLNQFDSLNQTLGSMTEFVSLAQPPSDADTLLGGTQGNGSPATGNALNSTQWGNVNSGDGGFGQINPANPDDWFTENTGVSIQECGNGASCRAGDFNPVVSSATVGGDGGPLYTPYVLDPQNPAELIVGTCRVWRGTTSSSSFTALSQFFDISAVSACTGSEVNTVRALAAGGGTAANGISSVIYAGTDGTGPLAHQPGGGHVWVTTNAASATVTWSDVTGNINPGNFPISAIALDPSDSSGNTAYITIMGFGVSHVWQTKNAGLTWTDFTGTVAGTGISAAPLPDAPVNAVVVDEGTVYVGSDVGVFSSTTLAPHWVELGGGSLGFLPDVPVTALRIFNDHTSVLLRAATYGRGIWQYALAVAPDFQITVTDPAQVVLASQTASYSGTVVGLDGYSAQVTLSCAGASVPSICMPTLNGDGSFTVAASGAVGDYSFVLQATGSDGLSRTAALMLHVVDFGLNPPSPAAVALQPGTTSGPISLQVSFLGTFPSSETLNLSCTTPSGVTCSFSPSAVVSPAQGNPANPTMTVAVSSSAAGGSFTVGIAASSSAGNLETVTQSLGLRVIRTGYALTLASGSSTVAAGHSPAPISGSAIAANGYSSTVTLSCTARGVSGAGPAPACTVSPTTILPTGSGAGFQVALGGAAAGSYSFDIKGVGSDAQGTTSGVPLAVDFYDFSVNVIGPGSQTVASGQTASYTLSLTPMGLSTFQQAVILACAGLPAAATCQFNTNPVSGGAQTVTLQVSTTASMAWNGVRMRPQARAILYAMLLPGTAMVLVLAGFGKTPRRQGVMLTILGSLVVLVLLEAACGGGLTGGTSSSVPSSPSPPGSASSNTYMFTVNATEGPLQANTPQLTLVVQ